MTARHDGHATLFQSDGVSPLKAHIDVPLPPYDQGQKGAPLVVGSAVDRAGACQQWQPRDTVRLPTWGFWAADGKRL